jgi:hypothetical protein
LERHPGLTHLHAFGHPFPLNPSPTLRIHLPNLQYFQGEATFIPAMMAHEIGEARLYWSGREDIERTVVALRSMTGPDIPFVSINNGTETDQCTALVEALATHIPNIKTLNMRAATDWVGLTFAAVIFSLMCAQGSPDRITIDQLTAYLPHFKGLMYLALEDALSDCDVDEESYSVRDKMHTVVVNWAGICPRWKHVAYVGLLLALSLALTLLRRVRLQKDRYRDLGLLYSTGIPRPHQRPVVFQIVGAWFEYPFTFLFVQPHPSLF